MISDGIAAHFNQIIKNTSDMNRQVKIDQKNEMKSRNAHV